MAPQVPPAFVVVNLGLALVATSNAPLLLLDDKLTIIACSKSFCESFQLDPAKVEGRLLSELGDGEWNKPQLSAMLHATAAGYSEIEAYAIDLNRKGKADLRLVLNAQKLRYSGEDEVRVVLSVTDVTQARIVDRQREALLRDKEILLQELHHRVANSLQIIASVLLQNARKVQSDETRTHLVDAHQRVMSVAALQKQLASSGPGNVELRPYFAALCNSIGASIIRDHDKVSLEVHTDDSATSSETSVSLGLIVTELVINALKHAFPDDQGGKIAVDYRSQGPAWTLSVGDNGVGMPVESKLKAGLGSSIVRALADQLGAEVSVADALPGTKVSIAHASIPVLVAQAAI